MTQSTLPQQVYKAYQRASHTVAKTRQVVMLYDGALRFLNQAKEAMEKNDIESRFNKLVRAGEIIMGLQSSLDFEAGEEVAKILFDFYSLQDARILNLHMTNDVQSCEAIMRDLREMRDVWESIDKRAGESALAQPVQEMPTPAAENATAAANPITVSA